MGTIVHCEDDTCRNYNNGVCGLKEIEVQNTYGVKPDGSGNGPINACANYRDRRRKNAGAD